MLEGLLGAGHTIATSGAAERQGIVHRLDANTTGLMIVAKSSQTGFEPLHRYTVADSATWAQPAISGNRVFIKDVSTLALWTVKQ